MKLLQNKPLAPYTSIRVGGTAEELVVVDSYAEMIKALESCDIRPWILGFGCNVLISDKGLPGKTVVWRGGDVAIEGVSIAADAGVWWDDVVELTIENKLWGIELMSEIPSSVGGAVIGNIAAYGQQTSDTLVWVEVFDFFTKEVRHFSKNDFDFTYRWSSLQNNPSFIVLRVGLELSKKPLHELRYDSALAVATELNLDPETLENRREIIIETRRRAGSLYYPEEEYSEHTAGSFFKNPLVSTEQARVLAAFDETGKTLERIENQSLIHGGDSHRASAAHVLLAAGFERGQTWGHVRLHPQHVLKIETLEGATATEVYAVVQEVLSVVKTKLNIDLEPEVRFLGVF